RPAASMFTFGPNISTDPNPPCRRISGEPAPNSWYARSIPLTWAIVATLVPLLIAPSNLSSASTTSMRGELAGASGKPERAIVHGAETDRVVYRLPGRRCDQVERFRAA